MITYGHGVKRLLFAVVILTLLYLDGAAQLTTVNSAVSLGTDCYRLVDTMPTGSKGGVWSPDTLDLSQPFDITFHTMIARPTTPNGGWSGDGFAFVLRDTGTLAIGGGGNGLGFGQNVGGSPQPPISPSVGIEVDTWNNSAAGVDDTTYDHMAVHLNGDMTNAVTPKVEALVGGANIDQLVGGAPFCRPLRITWDPGTNTLRAYYNGVLRITYVNNLVTNVFNGNTKVLFGMTASNGSTPTYMRVCYEFAHAGNDTALCVTDSLIMPGAGGVLYSWDDSLGFGGVGLSNNNTANPQFDPITFPVLVTEYKYYLTVTNQYGCVDDDSIRITVEDTMPLPNAGPDSTICNSSSINLYGNSLPQTGQWNFISGTNNPTLPSPFFENTPVNGTQVGGTYTFSWGYVNPPMVCPTPRDTVTISVQDGPTVDAGGQIDYCFGDSITLVGDTSGSGASPNQFTWTPSAFVVDSSLLTATGTPDTTMTFYILVEDTTTGCTAFDSVVANLMPVPRIDSILPDTFICLGDTIQLFSFDNLAADSNDWKPTSSLIGTFAPQQDSPLAAPTQSTTYVLTVYATQTGCFDVDSVRVDVFGAQLGATASDTSICRGDTIDLYSGAAAAADVTWSSVPTTWIENIDSIDTRSAPMNNTMYFVEVQDTSSQCAIARDSIQVWVQHIGLDVDPFYKEINPGQSVDIITIATPANPAGLTYDWSLPDDFNFPDIASPTVTPANTGPDDATSHTYTLTVTDTVTGCSNDTTIQIVLDPFERPNIFSPNGDGMNDILFVNYHGRQPYYTAIFDRWGNRIYETEDPNVNWDGRTSSGSEATEGVYYLVIKIEEDPTIPDERKNDAFHVTLVR